jgi:hypothetical protein
MVKKVAKAPSPRPEEKPKAKALTATNFVESI